MPTISRRNVLASLAPMAALTTPSLFAAGQPRLLPGAPLFSPTAYGAKANGRNLDTHAINAAIDACTHGGGGMVYLSPGTYKCGTIVLKSNVTLYLEAGATLLGSDDIADYTSIPGTLPPNDTGWRHLIFARDAENIGLAGPGTINGQGPKFWKPSGIPPLPPEDAWADVIARSVAAKGERPSPMIEFVDCKWVRVEDVRIEDAPSWTMRPVNCDQVHIRGISIRNPVEGHNTDGIDITGSSNVFISDCSIETGDDCICLKSENPYGREPRLTKNVVVTNCIMTTCSNGIKFGTATFGGFENISVTNCVIYNNDVDYKYRVVSGIAIEVVDGGWIDGVTISNIRMQRTRTPLFLRWGNRSNPYPAPNPRLRGIAIADIYATDSNLASSFTGLPGRIIRDVSLSNVVVENSLRCRPEWVGRVVIEKPDAYPEARMYGMLPCTGLYLRHVQDIEIRGFSVQATDGEARPAILLDQVENASLRDVRGTTIAGTQPLIQLNDSRDIWVTGCSLPRATSSLVSVAGASTNSITVSGNRVGKANIPVVLSPEVGTAAVTIAANF